MGNSKVIHVSGLRKESADGWTKLAADITYWGGGTEFSLPEKTIWIAVKDENAHMLADNVYDAFFLIPLYLGMYYKADLHIHGKMSKKLYRNAVDYLQRILCDFSDDLSRIDVKVEGFGNVEGEQSIIGTGISCGVDSLTTIYDRYVLEDDPEYRVNGLFFFNVGWHGDYYDPKSEELFFKRYELNRHAADELGLPVYLVKTNFHAFAYHIYGNNYPGGHMGYLACYSCVFGLGRTMKLYYMANGRSYEEIKIFANTGHDQSLSCFAESYMVPLIKTELLEIIIYGCQYERPQKMEIIADWTIAQKYLNVCVSKSDSVDDAHNCSKCEKCVRTLTTLEIMGKLQQFSPLFDLEVYKRIAFKNKCSIVLLKDKDANKRNIYRFAKSKGFKLPSRLTASLYFIQLRIKGFTKKIVRKLIGPTLYTKLKHSLKR